MKLGCTTTLSIVAYECISSIWRHLQRTCAIHTWYCCQRDRVFVEHFFAN